MNPLSDFFKSQEDKERLKKVEQLRKKGEKFIRVKYEGSIIPEVGNEGLCYNIRIHGLKDVEAYEQTDINTGKTEWHARKGARALHFRQSMNGDIEGDIWDDPDHWNRRFIATHPELIVVDSKLSEEIAEELDKPFKAELSRKEELEREIAEKVRELDTVNEAESKKKQASKKDVKKKKGVTNGLNKSASGVDHSGVSRVAAGGDGEGDSADIQPSSSDSEHSRERAEPVI